MELTAPGAATTPSLAQLRVAKGLSQAEVAARAGIKRSHLSKVERGEAGLSLPALYRLAVVLDYVPLVRILEPHAGGDDAA